VIEYNISRYGAHVARISPNPAPPYIYKGEEITEHERRIPFWVWLGAGTLFVCGIYDLIAYWQYPALI